MRMLQNQWVMASYYVFLVLALLVQLFLLFIKAKIKSSRQNLRLPPGPWNLPIIGSLHHFIGFRLPHHAFHHLSQRFGHIMFLQAGEQSTIAISSIVAAREILKTRETTFCNRPLGPTAKIFTYGGIDLVFAPYGEYWRDIRKVLVLHFLSSKWIRSFRSIREEEVSEMIQQISSLSTTSCRHIINLGEMVTLMSNKIFVRALTGSKSNGNIMFSNAIERSSELAAGLCVANLFPSSRLAHMISTRALRKAAECHKCIDQLTEQMVQEYRASHVDGEANDLLSCLLRLHESEKSISMDAIKAIIFDVLAGGTDRPGAVLTWAMSELVKKPTVLKKAQDEVRRVIRGRETIAKADVVGLDFLHLVIKETLRLHPLTPLLPRVCQETVNILDYDIPKGTTVLVNLWTIGRDPMYWKDAGEFNPDRFDNNDSADPKGIHDLEFFPFGAGRRTCPGKSFGLAIVELALANLLYHFNWELPFGQKPDELDMTENFGVNVKRKFPLLLHALPHKSW